MYYDLAGAEHDVDNASGTMARRSYLLCSNPRPGSTSLSEALHGTGRLGTPIKYFDGTDAMAALAGRWRCPDLRGYARCLHRRRTTPDGVRGAKVQWYQLQEVALAFGCAPRPGPYGHERALLASLFPACQFVFIVREDRDRQAVSWASQQPLRPLVGRLRRRGAGSSSGAQTFPG